MVIRASGACHTLQTCCRPARMTWAVRCRVGDPSVSQSEVFSFRTPQPTGFNSFPQKLGVHPFTIAFYHALC